MRGDLTENAYVHALLRDLEFELASDSRPLKSIFFGGGTPSLFSPDSIHRILQVVTNSGRNLGHIEITLEANPGTRDQEKFKGFFQAGVNRLSIGVQSFQNESLASLGRIHDANAAVQAYEMAVNAGFEQINLDLMFGLPNQSLKMANDDVCQAVSLQPPHISYYQLTLEPNTLFYAQPPDLPEDDLIWQVFEQGQAKLASANYKQYEVSAYAQQGAECEHNLGYWHFGDYIGVGAGAHGKKTLKNAVIRTSKYRQPQQYVDKIEKNDFHSSSDQIIRKDLVSEFMMNALRLNKGFPLSLFSETTGLEADSIRPMLNEAVNQSLITLNDGWLQPTRQGWHHLNELVLLFVD
jgi:putative oxygen-independent coproporphyrinogen III oxidase